MKTKKIITIFTSIFCFINLFYLILLSFYSTYTIFSNPYCIMYIFGPVFIKEIVLAERDYPNFWKMCFLIMGTISYALLLLDQFFPQTLQYTLFVLFIIGSLLCILVELKYKNN
ncbi:hypothetical protein MmiHf6_08050 [Methanimicrococcus hongohii]|uniref:Uncharacterized protein n=1 Tax=Methanimicrococcus hongohii TaxID=3028295 RepID=A0AA97A1R6_9EURY|nr:hypothetical protein MmiHf6_08050 [Methanimicrococcus sp. Hf6]